MTLPHTYNREIRADENNSLSVLASYIPAGATVLDVGCGTGAVGRFLAQRDNEQAGPIDGLTLSAHEAELAAPSYRRVAVADLDESRLHELFPSTCYDIIICADVLEHTRQPAQVLAQCRQLLRSEGRILISVPNVGYAGLLAELMHGDFRYRKEGLLDETHLRFFTRHSLLRMLQQAGWAVEHMGTIRRDLPDSEFRVAFDALPPAVARYLLGLPDAGTYQFLLVVHPASEGAPPHPPETKPEQPLRALFTSELYLGQNDTFSEANKITARGTIGERRQTLTFQLPVEPANALRIDPADRPGFLHLYAMRLRCSEGRLLWQWEASDSAWLMACPYSGLALQLGWWSPHSFMVLLYDDDPWIRLSIPEEIVRGAADGRLEIDLGWPMSADYIALANTVQQNREQHLTRQRELEQTLHATRGKTTELEQALHATQEEAGELLGQLRMQTQEHTALKLRIQTLRERNRTLLLDTLSLSQQRDDLNTRLEEARVYLQSIEHSTVFRVTRPLVHAKMGFDRLLGIGSARNQEKRAMPNAPTPLEPTNQPVDIIVPVYKGLADTQRCIASVLRAKGEAQWRLIVINDSSPEPEITAWLRQTASSNPQITLLENEENLGFVATVNRGMLESADHDVVLLNSDTEVADNWLDRLRRAAYSDQRVASVTPFSNNATICSYPHFCEDNELPRGWDTAELDALFAHVNAGQTIDVPTGVGFCMYIRRDALQQVGLFDVANFGRGYGEENDFCIRSANAGWRNLHALDVFVRHYGGVSFGAYKGPRERAAMETLRRLHPQYEAQVLNFIARDPARPARFAIDLERWTALRGPVILAVLHNRGGGTQRHVRELAALLDDRARFLTLEPRPGTKVRLQMANAGEAFTLDFSLPNDANALLAALNQLGVCHIHFHHLVGHIETVYKLPQLLGLSYDFTVHDYYTVMGNISLTDRQGDYCENLESCDPAGSPLPQGTDQAQWRTQSLELLKHARYVMAPSRDALARLIAVMPHASNLRLVPHTDIPEPQALPEPSPAAIPASGRLRVAVLGALSVIKGADTLEAVALAAHAANAPVEFHLVGFAYRQLKTLPHAPLTVHGAYAEADLPEFLEFLQPDLIWFPARWPETYSYTLSACLLGGWPVVAPDLGAFPERLAGRPWSWVCPWQQSPSEWLAFFEHIRANNFIKAQPPAPPSLPKTLEITAAIPVQAPCWYRETYLEGLEARPNTKSGLEQLLPYLPTKQAESVRAQALGVVARLRNQRLLSPLARAIPHRWQTRVKNWLLK